jgi:hypothetical protein
MRHVVEASNIYWVHPPSPSRLRVKLRRARGFGVAGVAIDRFTGQVIDKQIEVVSE